MKKNSKFKELLNNKEALFGIIAVLAMIVIAVIQFVLK